MNISRQEHPKPQFERETWQNLNGEWQFEFDMANSAEERKIYLDSVSLKEKINVPFCPESKLSGIGYTDFIGGAVYKRNFEITKSQAEERVLIHFGAVDYKACVYINEKLAGTHKGGYVSFAIDISEFVKEGTNSVCVIVADNTKDKLIPSGKQSEKYDSYGCFYTRTTGIWQTVWLEFTKKTYIESIKYYPDIKNTSVRIEANLKGKAEFKVQVFYEDRLVGSYGAEHDGGIVYADISLSEKHLWEIGCGRLYSVVLEYGEDTVKSYFGLRQVRLDGYKFLVNEKTVFQRLVLDQGFYPDGIYTAPVDEALKGDIELSMKMGFNGARLHEKVFEERFLYHADKLGYIVWGEYPDWGLDVSNPENIYSVVPEWIEEVKRDFNHPSIIGWCPHNETWDTDGRKQYDESVGLVYDITKAIDTTRPCIDTSGNFHVRTDIFDVHDYIQDPKQFAECYSEVSKGVVKDHIERNPAFDGRQKYDGKLPVFVSEYGGIKWSEKENAWGYGEGPKTKEEFLERLEGLTDVILKNECIMGFCYTQLTDVEQECNGLYNYDRTPKFEAEKIKKIFTKKAAIED